MIKRLIAGALLLSLVIISLHTPAIATMATMAEASPTWLLVDTSDHGTKVYARADDLRDGRPTSRAARLWIKLDSRRDTTVSWSEVKTLYAVDCLMKTYRTITSHVEYSNGRSQTLAGDGKTEFIVPDSVMEGATNILCAPPSNERAESTGYTA